MRRGIGPTSAAVLVVANMIGAGVFTTSGFALADLGRREWVLLAWLAGGVLALCGALSYGALARRLPESGGEYFFLSRTFHPLAGFLAGWVSLLAGFTAPIAVSALALQAYLLPGGGETEAGVRPAWLGTGAIALAVGMHGVRRGRGIVLQNVAVAVKLLLITGLVLYGAVRIPRQGSFTSPEPAPFDLGAFAVSLVWISFAYSGWNAAVYVAGEVREPERNLVRSLLGATLCVTVLYLGLNAVFLYAGPAEELAGRADVGAVAARALGGSLLRTAVSWLIALALFTSISSMVMAGPRVYARMADDGLFPRLFSSGGEVPTAAVLLQGAFAIVVVWASGLAGLLGYVGFTLGLSAAATVTSLMVLRRREGAERVPVPGYPWVPAVHVAATLAISGFLVVREPEQALWGLATVALGVPAYLVLRRGPTARS